MPRLTLRYNGVTVKEYELSGPQVTIGRRSDSQIQLDDPTVSGIHAILSVQPDPYLDGHYRVTLLDFNSTNGVFVNGERISKRLLRPGDVIRVGQHELLFDEPGLSTFEQTTVQLRDE